MIRLQTRILVTLFFLVALGACGQKGDLYHPGEKSTALESESSTA